ncbi:unnamed protein product [Effrenium voratum]|nr:unnamed protein product [Effrenium voratum]
MLDHHKLSQDSKATGQDVISSQGYRGLWRGAFTHCTASILGGIARLSALKTTQMWVMPGGNRHYQGFEGYLRRCSFLYVSGAGALMLVYPLDVAYTNLAADTGRQQQFRGAWHFLRETQRTRGILSLYRGLPLCLFTALPYICLATGLHDLLAPWLLKQMGHRPTVDHKSLQPGDLFWLVRNAAPAHLYPWNLVVGAASGFVAQTVTYPLDTLRRRWQFVSAGPTLKDSASLTDCAKSMYAAGGIRRFYDGVALNSLKLVPELLVLSGVYFVINASGNFLVRRRLPSKQLRHVKLARLGETCSETCWDLREAREARESSSKQKPLLLVLPSFTSFTQKDEFWPSFTSFTAASYTNRASTLASLARESMFLG